MRKSSFFVVVGVFVAISASVVPISGAAQTPQLNDATLRTVSPGSGEFIGVESSRTLQANQLAFSAVVGYCDDLFVIRNASGTPLVNIVDTRVSADFGLAYGFPWLEVGLIAPFVLTQSGIDQVTAGLEPVSGGGFGDLRLFLRRRLFGGDQGFALGASVTVDLPTSQVSFAGEEQPSVTPRLIPEFRSRYLNLALNAGVKVREEVTVVNTEIGPALQGGAGLALRNPWIKPLALLGEFNIEASGEGKWQIPYEARGALRWSWTDSLNMFLGYGQGLSSGVGAPAQRGVFMLAYSVKPRENKTIIQRIVVAPELVSIVGNKIEVNGELFTAADSDRIPSRATRLIDALAKKLIENPWIRKVRIIGHATTSGGVAFNYQLALRRAKALEKALVDRGIDAQRLQAYTSPEELKAPEPVELKIVDKDPNYQPSDSPGLDQTLDQP